MRIMPVNGFLDVMLLCHCVSYIYIKRQACCLFLACIHALKQPYISAHYYSSRLLLILKSRAILTKQFFKLNMLLVNITAEEQHQQKKIIKILLRASLKVFTFKRLTNKKNFKILSLKSTMIV